MPGVEQRGKKRKASQHVGLRLNAEDQRNVAEIIKAGLADSISDAIRCGLFFAARAARRVIKKRSDA